MNTVPPNTPSVSAQLLLKFSSIALTALLA